jgi:hypothetical protein
MATANSSISLASLDFDTLKNNLKAFLSTQSAFKDYDYEGSNMNVLLDVLSYNTFMNAFYLNMAVSEMFLDSAQLRSSVASHAKMLNYTPRSRRSAAAVINTVIPTSNANVLTIPKGTSFTGKNLNGNYTFTTDKTLTLTSGNNTFTAANLHIYEGSYSQDAFVMNYSDETQKFTLLNPNIDTESMVVVVSENNGANTAEFLLAENLFGLDNTSNSYFLQTDIDGRYQIVFGDGVLGRRPLNGAVITAEYRSCEGDLANGIDTFVIENDLGGINNTDVQAGLTTTTVANSADGAMAESIESIRYNAPRHFQTQERVVTNQDYIDLILANFPDIQSVNAYGGDVLSQFGDVEYGKVYISASTYSGNTLTQTRKNDLLSFLKPRAVLGITPIIIDPEYMYVTLSSKVHVDFTQTGLTPAQMNTVVVNAISAFNSAELQQFGRNFRLSALTSAIDFADASILSNETSTFIYKKFVDLETINEQLFTVDFHGNALRRGSILSNTFKSDGRSYILTDYISGVNNTAGNLYKLESTISTSAINYSVVGSVDYTNGTVRVSSTQIDSLPAGGLRIFASAVNQDVYANRNNIVEIDTGSGLSISIVSG